MHLKLLRAAASIALFGGMAAFGLGSAQAALASPTIVDVSCSTSTLISDMVTAQTVDDTVLILAPDCTYWLTEAYDATTSGLPMVDNDLTIVGHDSTWIERSYEDDTPSFGIFSVCSAGDLTLNDVNVANGGGSDHEDGGAVYIYQGTLTVHGGTFNDNNTEDYGGAIDNQCGTLTVDGATFTDNSTGEYGGAIYSENYISTATLSGDTFSRNDSSEYGGAIANDDNDMTITNSTFSKNGASDDGGAIYNDYDLTVNGSGFSQNEAEYGGAMYNNDDLTVNHSSITNKNSAYQGGGFYNDDETLTINYSTVTYNLSSHGGGAIYNYDDGTVTLTGDLINWNFIGNCEPVGSVPNCPN
jgi:predicted outer membrane repeat protein